VGEEAGLPNCALTTIAESLNVCGDSEFALKAGESPLSRLTLLTIVFDASAPGDDIQPLLSMSLPEDEALNCTGVVQLVPALEWLPEEENFAPKPTEGSAIPPNFLTGENTVSLTTLSCRELVDPEETSGNPTLSVVCFPETLCVDELRQLGLQSSASRLLKLDSTSENS
jgi:hypothetical protein